MTGRRSQRNPFSLAAAFAALALAFAPAAALAEPAPLEGVVVEGRRLDHEQAQTAVHAFVGAIARYTPGQSLMRWREPVCPLVGGLPRDQGEFVLARISQVAREAGAPLGRPDCKPNFYVVVTSDPEALLTAWRARDGNLFGRQPPAKVGRFLGTDRPVRVWHNWDYTPDDGVRMARDQGEYLGAWALFHADDSRQITNAVRSLWGAVVVVDADQVDGVSVGQLADYIAMTGLADLDPDAGAAAGAPTILRLFDGPPADAPAGLSDWDRAFLRALYATEHKNLKQRAQIAGRMLTALSR